MLAFRDTSSVKRVELFVHRLTAESASADRVAASRDRPDGTRERSPRVRGRDGRLHPLRARNGRTQVVFGAGHPDADLMFVGEAPGFHEDQQGVPFVGQAGKLLDKLLAGIGLERSRRLHRERLEVPPAREPRPAAGRDRGLRVAPVPADRADPAARSCDARQLRHEALSGKPLGITRVHGQPQDVTLGGSNVTLYPLYHPAAALYTPSMLSVLEEDFARLPELLGTPRPEPIPAQAARLRSRRSRAAETVQLGLFWPFQLRSSP